MKLDRFLTLIREEVRKVVREELKVLINENANNSVSPGNYKKTLLNSMKSKNTGGIIEEDDDSGDPIKSILSQTHREMMAKSGHTNVDGLLSETRNELSNKFKPQTVGTVSDMFRSTQVSNNYGEEVMPDAETVGEISVVPDFTKIMNKFKERGDI